MYKNNSSVMKRWVAGLSAAFVMALSGLVHEGGYAQETNQRFYCGKDSAGRPATIFDDGKGRKVIIIVWHEGFSSYSYIVTQKQCEAVSENFDLAYREGSLNYFLSANSDGYPVICASRVNQGVCDRLLFTLNEWEDPIAVITKLYDINMGLSSDSLYLLSVSSRNGRVINIIEWSSRLTDENNQKLTFTCDTANNKTPTTIARIDRREIPIIIWRSSKFSNADYSPQKRCQKVSRRFEELRQKNVLNYITSGRVNDLPVICAVKIQGEKCTKEGLLFTLAENADPQKVLEQMFLSNSNIPIDADEFGKRNGRDSVCLSRSPNGNCSGLLISGLEL